jgi:hypothetical protein
MIVEVGENLYGWGGDVEQLPTDPQAVGPKLIDSEEAKALEDEVERYGWKAAGADGLEVFLVAPKAWKRPIRLSWDEGDDGKYIQIRVAENTEVEQPPAGDPADFDTPPEGTPVVDGVPDESPATEPPDEPKDAGEDA